MNINWIPFLINEKYELISEHPKHKQKILTLDIHGNVKDDIWLEVEGGFALASDRSILDNHIIAWVKFPDYLYFENDKQNNENEHIKIQYNYKEYTIDELCERLHRLEVMLKNVVNDANELFKSYSNGYYNQDDFYYCKFCSEKEKCNNFSSCQYRYLSKARRLLYGHDD